MSLELIVSRESIRPWPELQAMLPVLSRDQKRSLKESIEQNRLTYKVQVLPDGRIVDGVNRWEVTDGKCDYEVLVMDPEQAFAHGLALNLARRQVSAEQLAEIHEKMRQHKDMQKRTARELRRQRITLEEVAAKVGVSKSTIANWEAEWKGDEQTEQDASVSSAGNACIPPFRNCRTTVPKAEYPRVYQRIKDGESQEEVASSYGITRQRVAQIASIVIARERDCQSVGESPALPKGRYRCIVIDPPWPVEKIEREERPDQGNKLEYAVMSLDQIETIIGKAIDEKAVKAGCHVYLWATQKFLPEGFRLFEAWGVKYQCLMTWVKPTGITPYSWMYNTEHVLFGRIGSLALERVGLKLSFEAKTTRHSAKPDTFYERVREASPGPRLEMFARKQRVGFDVWGHEVRDQTIEGFQQFAESGCPIDGVA